MSEHTKPTANLGYAPLVICKTLSSKRSRAAANCALVLNSWEQESC